jgi:hypothetical protein
MGDQARRYTSLNRLILAVSDWRENGMSRFVTACMGTFNEEDCILPN